MALRAARGVFATWLRERRVARGQSIEDVARVTRIQQRTLERLESGRFDELPADVFVRGFIRNYARVVGIDPDDALARYGDCGVAPAPVVSLEAQALLEAMAALAPEGSAAASSPTVSAARALGRARTSSAIEIEPAVLSVEASVELPPVWVEPAPIAAPIEAGAVIAEAAPAATSRPPSKSRRRGRRIADGTTAPATSDQPKSRRRRSDSGRRGKQASAPAANIVETIAPAESAIDVVEDLEVDIEIIATPMPMAAPIHVAPTHQARPARRPARVAPTMVLSIDDADPDSAERTRAARAALEDRDDKEPSRRSFLPPVLLDDERSGRQGGLTLAVIILLIVATLTLSYLMRRPSSTGEGITQRETATLRMA